MVGYLGDGTFTPLDGSTYTVRQGVGIYEELDADKYEEIYTLIQANFVDLAGRLTQAESDIDDLEDDVADIVSGETKLAKVSLDTVNPSATLNVGETRWNDDEKTIETKLSTNVTVQNGQVLFVRARNGETSTITNGTVVYIYGELGNSGKALVKRASNTTHSQATSIIGVATEAIAQNQEGFITVIGRVRGLNLSSYAIGTKLYLGTNGALTSTAPTKGVGTRVYIGVVENDSATEGILLVSPRILYNLDDLSNVQVTSVANNNVIVWNTANNRWQNMSYVDFCAILLLTNNTWAGTNTFNGAVTFGSTASGQTPTADAHLTRKDYVDTKVSTDIGTHNTSTVAHESIRQLIEALEQEIARLDGRGKSYGEINKTTAEMQAYTDGERATAIKNFVEAQTWFTGTYTPSNGDLVYDTGVGAGVDYHEWEYNGTAWVDNGAINSPKASNTIFGTVKGNDYVSIVSGLIEVLKSNYAERLGVSGGSSFTYAQLVDYITNAINSLVAIQGVEVEVLTQMAHNDTKDSSIVDAYDLNLNPHGSSCCDNCESILICRKAWDFLYKGDK
jgi:hypothetical protein